MMEVVLPTGRRTSRLGFGGAVLHGGSGARESLRLLSAAYDAGIRHFDVAPIYGLGTAEDVLGQFLRGHRNAVTVTTKVGLARPERQHLLAVSRRFLRPMLSSMPAFKQRVATAAYRKTRKTAFGVAEMRASLQESLRRLGVEQIDVLLLHEFSVDDMTDEALNFLEDAKREGHVGCYGIGSQWQKAAAVAQRWPQAAAVIQTDWCLLDDPLKSPPGSFVITHGALRRRNEVLKWLAENDRRDKLARVYGGGLESVDGLNDMLLASAMANNQNGIILVASTKPDRYEHLVSTVGNRTFLEKGRHFLQTHQGEL